MLIVDELITETKNFKVGRSQNWPVDTVVIHVEEGSDAATESWFNDPTSHVSSHYSVDKVGGIDRLVKEEDTANANGRVAKPTAAVVVQRLGVNPNDYTISIEHEGDGKHPLTDAQKKSTVDLLCDIWERNSSFYMDRKHVIGHHEIFANKTCPGKIDVDELVDLANKQLTQVHGSL